MTKDEILLRDKLPPEYVMKEMSKLAWENATTEISKLALRLAQTTPADMSGPDALRAFAAAILSTNSKLYGDEAKPS